MASLGGSTPGVVDGILSRLGVDLPPVLDTIDASCLYNFILDRPVLSIVYDILEVYQTHDLTMVLTAAQTTTFFEHAEQMGIPHATVMQLQSKGITLVSDLVDFDKDSLQQLVDNLRRPGGCVLDPNPGAPPGSTIPTPPFVFGAKSQKCISITCDLVRYYTTVGRDLTVANIQWNTVMKNSKIQWTALKERKGDDSPDTPKISKVLPVIKWTEAFQDFLNRKIGNCNISLVYIICDEPNPPATALPLAVGQPHSIEHGSVEAELIARASHTHALFRDDNSDRPELDVSTELMPRDSAYYQSLIGILRWIVELGRIDICLEVSMMSSHLAMPRKGHLDQVLHIFAYLHKYHNTELVYDPSDPVVEYDVFE